MQPEEHLIVDLADLVLGQLQVLDLQRSLEGIRFDASNQIPAQIQLDEIRKTTEKSVGLDAHQLIVVQQPGIGRRINIDRYASRSFCSWNSNLQLSGVQRNVSGNFHQSSGRTVHLRPFAVAIGRTFRVDSTLSSISRTILLIAFKHNIISNSI